MAEAQARTGVPSLRSRVRLITLVPRRTEFVRNRSYHDRHGCQPHSSSEHRRSVPTRGGSVRPLRCVVMRTAPGFAAGTPPQWDVERFLRGDEVDTALITLERNRLTFAWKCADLDADGMALALGSSRVTLGGLLKHLAWVEELYFQHRLAGRSVMAPFDRLDLESDWQDWPWRTASQDTPTALRALWAAAVHRSRAALGEALAEGELDQPSPSGMSLRRLLADLNEEYARHTGHADLLREAVDGSTGEGAPRDFPVP